MLSLEVSTKDGRQGQREIQRPRGLRQFLPVTPNY
jgi:hypothetical protein